MNYRFPRSLRPRSLAVLLTLAMFSAPLRAQQPAASPNPPAPANSENKNEPTFDTLLSADSYKLYGEARNVGQLLTTGGAGELIEPIFKLANPGEPLTSIVDFLKINSEALANTRLMFATWPMRSDIPSTFVALEFASREEAAKFTPHLKAFLPKVLPPVPVETPMSSPSSQPSMSPPADNVRTEVTVGVEKANSAAPQMRSQPPQPVTPPASPEMRLPFVITHSGSLVVISDRSFKFEKLRPPQSGFLFEDHDFRVARDRFSSEPLFLFFDLELEDRTKPKSPTSPTISGEDRDLVRLEADPVLPKQSEEERAAAEKSVEPPSLEATVEESTTAVLVAGEPSPTPTPSKEREAQMIASSQIGNMMNMLGQGEAQWPEAIGVAVALDNEEYVVRAILIEAPNSKRLVLPFIPQLFSGPSTALEAPSILPQDTEVVVSASIDFAKTYQEMKKQAEKAAKNTRVQTSAGENAPPDSFAEFEKKAGFKISDDLLPVLGNELAVAVSLKMANMAGMFGFPSPPPPKQSAGAADKDKEKGPEPMPVFLIAIKDREAARRLMPRVLDGLGIGAANLLAQTERRDDSEIVNYAGIFSYAFVGNFLVLSDSASVRRIVEANSNRQTLSSNNAFRNARHWQARQMLGEIYVSPALMEGYQEMVRSQAGTMDPAMRDFLMMLSPKSNAITYGLSHDGLGALHELHLPKNLILAMVAGTSAAMSAMKQGGPEMNEMVAIGALQMLASGEETYKATAGNGSYGSIEELVEKKLLTNDMFDKYGYNFAVSVTANGFAAVATPMEYGKTGKRSFFVDQTNVVRGDDHGGGPATSADKPVQ